MHEDKDDQSSIFTISPSPFKIERFLDIAALYKTKALGKMFHQCYTDTLVLRRKHSKMCTNAYRGKYLSIKLLNCETCTTETRGKYSTC